MTFPSFFEVARDSIGSDNNVHDSFVIRESTLPGLQNVSARERPRRTNPPGSAIATLSLKSAKNICLSGLIPLVISFLNEPLAPIVTPALTSETDLAYALQPIDFDRDGRRH